MGKRIFISQDGRINDDELMKHLELIAEEKIIHFHRFLENASAGQRDSLDWWVSGISSRNCFTSPIFFNLLCVTLLKEMIEGDDLSGVTTDSSFLFVIIKRLINETGSDVVVRLSIDHVRALISAVKFFAVLVLSLPKFVMDKLLAGNEKNKPELKRDIVLVSCFANDDVWFERGDRYFPGFDGLLNEEEMRDVYFLPRVYVERKSRGLRRLNQYFRSGTRKVLILEDYVRISDCIYAWLHWYRVLRYKKPILFWDGIDVTPLFYKEVLSHSSLYGGMRSVLYYRFVYRLYKNGVGIKTFLNFFENQIVDKALHKGINDFYPMSNNVGYEGYSPVTKYYCSFPVENEKKSGVLPSKLALPGEGHKLNVCQYIENIDVVIAPHFRGSSISGHIPDDDSCNYIFFITSANSTF